MLSNKEKEERRHQIGASEIHKLLNFDSQEAQDLWEIKIGIQRMPELENDAITAGNILEEKCLNYYAKTNNKDLILNERIPNKRVVGLVVSLDAREEQTSIPVENKVINENTFEKWKSKRVCNAIWQDIKLNIPKSYYCQVQIQIATLNAEYGILNVNTLTDEEQEDPINVEITFLHNKQIKIEPDNYLINDLENRAKYMFECMKFKKRPSEKEYLEKYVF